MSLVSWFVTISRNLQLQHAEGKIPQKSYTALQFMRSLTLHISTMVRQSHRQPTELRVSNVGQQSNLGPIRPLLTLLRNSILLVTFHHIVFVYYHYSSYSHRSGLETANFISPPTFLFNATPSATAVTKILLHYGRWFPAYFISSVYAENQTWVNKFLGFYIRRNIFLGKTDIGISGGKNKNITVEIVFYFFSTFPKITVGGFVNQFK